MKLFRILCILCFPSFLFQPIAAFPHAQQSDTRKEIFIPRDERGKINPWGYFDIQSIFTHPKGHIDHCFSFIELLCQEDFIDDLSEEELERALDFSIQMIRLSIPASRADLQDKFDREVDQLLEGLEDDCYTYESATCYASPEIHLCKSWLKKKWGRFKKWCDDHKKELIIGAAVTTAIVIGVVTGGVGGSAATAVGGALIGEMQDTPSPQHINKPGEVVFVEDLPQPPRSLPTPTIEPLPPVLTPTPVYDKIEQEAETAIIALTDETHDPINAADKTFWEEIKDTTKDTASHLAHEVLDTAAEIGEYYHQLNPTSAPDQLSSYRKSIDTTHQVIDQVFQTEQASLYTQESKDALASSEVPEMQTGTLPPPSSLTGVISRALSAARAAGVVGAAAVGSAVTQPSSTLPKEPPYNGKDLGSDPAKPPAAGFEWKGSGPPESGRGNWVKGRGEEKETLYPDLDHSLPIGPHWDYTGPSFPDGARLFPDGSWEVKS